LIIVLFDTGSTAIIDAQEIYILFFELTVKQPAFSAAIAWTRVVAVSTDEAHYPFVWWRCCFYFYMHIYPAKGKNEQGGDKSKIQRQHSYTELAHEIPRWKKVSFLFYGNKCIKEKIFFIESEPF
jgi:hypothetical protein